MIGVELEEFQIFSQGACQDGAAILKVGVPMTPEQIVEHLNKLTDALALYGDPTFYHGITIMVDRPAGGFPDDFSDNAYYDYPKGGATARRTFDELNYNEGDINE